MCVFARAVPPSSPPPPIPLPPLTARPFLRSPPLPPQLSASANLMEKRVSYLCASLCFAPDHAFRMMLVNRIQRDLQSANVLEASIALSAASKILTTDMIPAVLPIITNLLKHDQEIIRKKSVMLIQRFLALQPESVTHMGDKFRRALCDKDPAVMGASLHIFADLCKVDPTPYKDLVSSFVSILKQVTEHRLPRDFDYHRTPAPWIQLRLLRILATLGRADHGASEQMYEVLLDVMRKADTGINVGYAIAYECVRTVTTIYPNTALLDAAAASIARFISSDNHNLKYLGVTGLAAIVKDHPKYAGEHQLAVIECLEDPDDTLKRKTLDLLYRMTNPVNVEVIVGKLLEHLRGANDEFLRGDLVSRITQVAERFAPSNEWYITTMTTVFELGGDLVKPEVAMNLMRLIAEGSGESEEADRELRREAVEALLALVDKPALPDILLQTMFWVLGEYGYLAASSSLGDIAEKVLGLAGRAGIDAATRGYAISAVLKLTSQLGSMPPAAALLIAKFGASRQVDLAQRCHELTALSARPGLIRGVLPVDASTEDIDVDVDMHFLDSFVAEALSAGARSYAPPAAEGEEDGGSAAGGGGGAGADGGLRFEAYERQDASSFLPGTEGLGPGGGAGAFDAAGGAGGGAGGNNAPFGAAPLNLTATKGAWSREGYKTAQGVLQEAPKPGAGGGGGAPAGMGASAPDAAAAAAKRPWDYGGAPAPAPAPAAASSSSSYAMSAPAAAPAPPAPRELTEKEKMAAALFGGMGGASASKAATPAKKVAAAAPAPAPAPAAVAPPSVPARAPAPAPAPKPAPADDLLDIFGSSAPAPAPAPRPGMMGGGGGGLDDLFAAPAPAPVAAAPADPFGGAFGGLSLGGGAAPAPAAGLDLNTLSLPPQLAGLVAIPGAAREPAAGNTRCAGDAVLAVAFHKVFAPDALHLVLFLANTSAGQAVPAAQIALQAPAYLRPTVQGGSPAGPGTVQVGPIPPRGSAAVVVSFALAAVPQSGSIRGTVAYQGGAAPLPFSIESDVTDCLRPAPIDTPSFGGIWTQPAMAAEAVNTVPAAATTVRTPADLMARVGPQLRMHPVQAIAASELLFGGGVGGGGDGATGDGGISAPTSPPPHSARTSTPSSRTYAPPFVPPFPLCLAASEAIAAARVMGLPTVFCLLHARLLPQGLELRIKTAEANFTQAVVQAASAKLR